MSGSAQPMIAISILCASTSSRNADPVETAAVTMNRPSRAMMSTSPVRTTGFLSAIAMVRRISFGIELGQLGDAGAGASACRPVADIYSIRPWRGRASAIRKHGERALSIPRLAAVPELRRCAHQLMDDAGLGHGVSCVGDDTQLGGCPSFLEVPRIADRRHDVIAAVHDH